MTTNILLFRRPHSVSAVRSRHKALTAGSNVVRMRVHESGVTQIRNALVTSWQLNPFSGRLERRWTDGHAGCVEVEPCLRCAAR